MVGLGSMLVQNGPNDVIPRVYQRGEDRNDGGCQMRVVCHRTRRRSGFVGEIP